MFPMRAAVASNMAVGAIVLIAFPSLDSIKQSLMDCSHRNTGITEFGIIQDAIGTWSDSGHSQELIFIFEVFVLFADRYMFLKHAHYLFCCHRTRVDNIVGPKVTSTPPALEAKFREFIEMT